MKDRVPLVEVVEGEGLEISFAYATDNNFTGKAVYTENARCFLHPEAKDALTYAWEIARKLGYGLKIFDAYRPTEVQWALWNHSPDPNFLAHPERGSPHSRGVAVDLTLTDAEGRELPMGTPFDAFTPLSHHGNLAIDAEATRNRMVLMGIMTTAGWDFYRNEWWHYQLFQSREYPLWADAEAGTHMITDDVRRIAAEMVAASQAR